ncbi:MAG: C39 family peptidase, partial [Candidatus Omnitrophica bacterium]|nr:C39 family peptidase [Candidatus Omnitrophota bacterium]
ITAESVFDATKYNPARSEQTEQVAQQPSRPGENFYVIMAGQDYKANSKNQIDMPKYQRMAGSVYSDLTAAGVKKENIVVLSDNALPTASGTITPDYSANAAGLQQAATDLNTRIGTQDTVVFTYLGHGTENYINPADGSARAISENTLSSILTGLNAAKLDVVMDSCSSGTLTDAFQKYEDQKLGIGVFSSSDKEETWVIDDKSYATYFFDKLTENLKAEGSTLESNLESSLIESHTYAKDIITGQDKTTSTIEKGISDGEYFAWNNQAMIKEGKTSSLQDPQMALFGTGLLSGAGDSGTPLQVSNTIVEERNENLAWLANIGKSGPAPVEQVDIRQTGEGLTFTFDGTDQNQNAKYQVLLFNKGDASVYSDNKNAIASMDMTVSPNGQGVVNGKFNTFNSGDYAIKVVPTGADGGVGKYSVFEFQANPWQAESAKITVHQEGDSIYINPEIAGSPTAGNVDKYELYVVAASDSSNKIQALTLENSQVYHKGSTAEESGIGIGIPETNWLSMENAKSDNPELKTWLENNKDAELQLQVVTVDKNGRSSEPLIGTITNNAVTPTAPASVAKVPFFSQPEGSTVCGIKTIDMLLNYYGVDKSDSEIGGAVWTADKANPGQKTTYLTDMENYLDQYGQAKTETVSSFGQLQQIYNQKQEPFIYLSEEQKGNGIEGHYIVVSGIDHQGNVYFNDPLSFGPNMYSAKTFQAMYVSYSSKNTAVYFDSFGSSSSNGNTGVQGQGGGSKYVDVTKTAFAAAMRGEKTQEQQQNSQTATTTKLLDNNAYNSASESRDAAFEAGASAPKDKQLSWIPWDTDLGNMRSGSSFDNNPFFGDYGTPKEARNANGITSSFDNNP